MIHFEPVTENNVWEICNLKVADNQKDFVADNRDSIVEAYTTI